MSALCCSLHGTPTMANQVVHMLSRPFFLAERWGIAPEGGNPCRFMKKYREKNRERFFCLFTFSQYKSSRSKGASV